MYSQSIPYMNVTRQNVEIIFSVSTLKIALPKSLFLLSRMMNER